MDSFQLAAGPLCMRPQGPRCETCGDKKVWNTVCIFSSCGGVLLMPREAAVAGRFRLPYINTKFIVPALFIIGLLVFWTLFTQLLDGDKLHQKFPFFLFIILSLVLTVMSFLNNLSLIPVLGLMSCFHLMTELPYQSWERFLIWLAVGLIVYFTFGYKNSVLEKRTNAAK